MPNTMAMSIRTLATVGISTITAVGIPLINPNRTGRAQKIISKRPEANLISSDHLNRDHRKRAARTVLPKAALIVPVAASTDLAVAVEAVPAIWIVRLRTDHAAIFRVSVSRVFKAGAATALAAEADSVVIVSVVAADSAAVIASAVEHSAAVAASADSAAAAGGADEDNAWNSPILFLEKLKTH